MCGLREQLISLKVSNQLGLGQLGESFMRPTHRVPAVMLFAAHNGSQACAPPAEKERRGFAMMQAIMRESLSWCPPPADRWFGLIRPELDMLCETFPRYTEGCVAS
eukprot:6479192-Amphidinium_carterae.1